MAQFMFYDNLVPLNRERHKDMRIAPAKSVFGHVRNVNSVPLAAVEFAEAAHEYAIIFAGADKDNVTPVAMLGLADQTNYYVDGDGNWTDGYRPAFVRMYPFVLANKGNDEYAVCIDENFEGLNDKEGERLFEEDGTESAGMKRAVEFLTQFHGEMRRTSLLVDKLKEYDLLISRDVNIRRKDGQNVNLKGMFVVDEAKLRDLDDAAVLDMHKNGMMACIYAHLLSLRNLARLTEHADLPAQKSA